MNKVAKAGLDVAKGGTLLAAWTAKTMVIGLIKTTYHGSKAAYTVHKRYRIGAKIEKEERKEK